MTALVEAHAISVRAGPTRLLDHVDLAVRRGESVAIVGPNGAGKSTLLRALSGELRPQGGSVRLKGKPVSAYAPNALARHRAVLSQSVSVAFPFTVGEVVRMGANDRRGPTIDALVDAALAEVDLAAAEGRIITTMSGGEQHRAHLARVFVQLACGEAEHGPGLLLLDEPTASLDLRHQIDLVGSTRRRAACGTAVIAVLHDLNLAATFADRIVVLHRGAVAADGSVAATLTDDLLRRVFQVDLPVGLAPNADTPFVLPQMMTSQSQPDARRPDRPPPPPLH